MKRLPRWIERVNEPITKKEKTALQKCIQRGCPFGTKDWVATTAKEQGLEITQAQRTATKACLKHQFGSRHLFLPRCGLLIIDLKSGDIVEWMRFEDPIRELYDVIVLPDVKRPRLVGFKSDEIRTVVWADPDGLSSPQT